MGVDIVTKHLRVAGALPAIRGQGTHILPVHPPSAQRKPRAAGKHLASGHQPVNSGNPARSPGPQSLLHRLMGRETQSHPAGGVGVVEADEGSPGAYPPSGWEETRRTKRRPSAHR